MKRHTFVSATRRHRLDPLSLGADGMAAHDFAIASADALLLQQVASGQPGFAAAVPEPSVWALCAGGLGLPAWRRPTRNVA
ncbi:MAG: hypothetical protein M3Y67_04770 [Pseudomonadota bacterium]|nr:hypothetical protein [Pseudomonadota bacterium]